jgi:2,3-bisphosphoglycerate-independent phosphoglycerate mutase
VVLVIRDGWGHNPDASLNSSNAVYLAKKPVTDALMAKYPSVLIKTSGFEVGLPQGTMGNSEVGHQNIGAGRIVDQDSGRISRQIVEGGFFTSPELNAAVDFARKNGGALQLMGLVSDGGVHALMEHFYACCELAKRKGLTKVYLHAFMDGRDTPPQSGIDFMKQMEAEMKKIGVGEVATVIGRYWAMDRDNRWDRVEKAYRAMVLGDGRKAASATEALEHYYANPASSNMTGDEFVTPSIINPQGLIKDGDGVIFVNFRGDRPREIARAFVLDTFPFETSDKDGKPVTYGFARAKKLNLYFVTMTAYEKALPVKVAFVKPPKMVNILGDYLAQKGLTQLRCAETEKFAHVTFFFNDYREEPFPGEDRKLIASPKVATYDLKPEMSAPEVGEAAAAAIDSGHYDFVVINFANGDMVGHTGNLQAAIQAIEAVDAALGKVVAATQRRGGALVITADHGNAEEEMDPTTKGPHTAHTTFDVPLIVADDRYIGKQLRQGGKLADIAPTCLELMGLPKPAEMTGTSLLQ